MCTLTLIPLLGARPGFRLAFSRDESRSRAPATQPRAHLLPGGVTAHWPVDTEAGGTWIAAGDQGLVLCLLNLNLEPPPTLPRGLVSRGLIVPRLIGKSSAAAAIAGLEGMDLDSYAPFRLAAVELDAKAEGGERLLVARWDRSELSIEVAPADGACLVSSGLGDSRVTPRIDLFQEMLDASVEVDGDLQDRFHAHTWEDRPELSVMMRRADARTVSITTVEMRWAAKPAIPLGGSVNGHVHVGSNGHLNGNGHAGLAKPARAEVLMRYVPVPDAARAAKVRPASVEAPIVRR